MNLSKAIELAIQLFMFMAVAAIIVRILLGDGEHYHYG